MLETLAIFTLLAAVFLMISWVVIWVTIIHNSLKESKKRKFDGTTDYEYEMYLKEKEKEKVKNEKRHD